MKHKIITFLFVMILIFPIRINASEKIKVTLDRCVDGDTAVFKVKKESKKTRFLGVNTPESVKENSPVEPYGKQASNYTCKCCKKHGGNLETHHIKPFKIINTWVRFSARNIG